MSAIHSDGPKISGVRTYYTHSKLEIFSHTTGKHTLKQVIAGFELDKQLKSAGRASFALIPSRNWLNFIYPNDYVNFYIDRGDGKGWVRTFFGYVDSIRETHNVESNGNATTVYRLACSDFQKALEKTQIYFNPSLDPDRKDLDGSWLGSFNIAGVALATKGIPITGSPPDALLATLYILMGGGGQFVLPNGFEPTSKTRLREQRSEYARRRLEENVIRSIPRGVELLDFLEKAEQLAKLPNDQRNRLRTTGLGAAGFLPGNLSPDLASVVTDALFGAANNLQGNAGLGSIFETAKNILKGSQSTVTYKTLLDVLDTAGYVERESIDGYMDNVTIWQGEGSVMHFLSAVNNEPVNELFFDLRPVQRDETGKLQAGTSWSTEEDDTKGNQEEGYPDGVQYTPAVVLREYPFSTIENLDLSGVETTLRGADSKRVPVGKIQLGSIFSDAPNTPGRHTITVKNINLEDYKSPDFDTAASADLTVDDLLEKATSKYSATKHIDVAVIDPQEIISSDLGRSDAEVFNLLTIQTDALLNSYEKFFLPDMLPIITPISLARNGLRVKETTTHFARFSVPEDKLSDGSKTAPAEADTDTVAPNFNGTIHYPMNAYLAGSPYAKWRVYDTNFWRLHHGIDLVAPLGTPVYAVADGFIAVAAPDGAYSGYGNVVLVEHVEPYQNSKVFSTYAHLQSIAPGILSKTNPSQSKKRKDTNTSALGGKMPRVPVSAGEVIGYCGNTEASADPKAFKRPMGVHLHFEITKRFPTKGPDNDQRPPKQPKVGNTPPPPPDPATTYSMDPVAFFASHGMNLLSPGTDPTSVLDDADNDGQDDNDTVGASDNSGSQNDSLSTADDAPRKNLDNYKIRIQGIRWAVLMDHWNQHNHEYLSGTITMRGAPEIRVGYRLDINYPNGPMSFYIEGVSHSWRANEKMTTTLTVTRGQRNDLFPVYVIPYLKGKAENQRKAGSRLGKNFEYPSNTSAVASYSLLEDKVNPFQSGSPDMAPDLESQIGIGQEINVASGQELKAGDL